jgi:hypothetical protein
MKKGELTQIKERLDRLESIITNHLCHKLAWHDKLIYTVLAMLLMILTMLLVEVTR